MQEEFVYGIFQKSSISADHFEADLTYDELELNNDNKKFTSKSFVINGTKSSRKDFMMANINSDGLPDVFCIKAVFFFHGSDGAILGCIYLLVQRFDFSLCSCLINFFIPLIFKRSKPKHFFDFGSSFLLICFQIVSCYSFYHIVRKNRSEYNNLFGFFFQFIWCETN